MIGIGFVQFDRHEAQKQLTKNNKYTNGSDITQRY